MNRISHIARRYGFDALIMISAIMAALEVVLRQDPVRAPRTTLWFLVPAVVMVALPLLGYRLFPFAAPAALWMLAAALSFVDGRLIVFIYSVNLAGTLAAFLLGNLADPVQRRTGLVVVLSGVMIVVYNDPNQSIGEFIFTPVLFAMAWLVGFAIRERTVQAEVAEARASQAERDREAAARIAVAEERTRIARELHDVVAHAVSVMVLQVGAVRHRLPENLAEDREALSDAEHAGRTALNEMRRLLGAMRTEADTPELAPQPGLDDLGSLMRDVERAGLPVRLRVEGSPFPLPRSIDLSAYRIVQEGLTNALKHAGAGHADVALRYDSGELTIEVSDDGAGASPGAGAGYGLTGIEERVKIYGGEMSAATGPGGGFVLRTRLPVGGDT